MKNSRNKIYAVDILMSFITVFGVVMFLPMLPYLQDYFAVSVAQISWLPNLGYLTMIIFSTVVGKFISKFRIKSLLLVSLVIWIAGILVELVALGSVNFYLFAVGRFIEGVGEAFIFPILLSMNKRELSEDKEEKLGLSLIEFGAALGGLIAAIISGKFTNYPKQFLIIPIVIAVITGVFIIIRIKSIPLIKEQKQVVNEKVKESMKAYISLLFMIFMIQTIFASTQVYLAYYMEAFKVSNLTGTVISIEQIVIGLGTLAPIFMFKKMSFKGIRNIIVIAFVGGVIILALQISIYMSILAAALIAFFVGLGFTVLNINISKILKTKVSQKLSIYTSIRFTGGFMLSFLWGKLIEGYRASGESYAEIFRHLYLFEGIMIIVIFIIITFLQKREGSFEKSKAGQKFIIKEV